MAIQFLNAINVDSGVLYTDVVNNRVGIGTTSPSSALSVASPSSTSIVYSGHYSSSNQNNFFETGINSNDGYLILRNSGVVSTVKLNSDGYSYFNGGNVGIGTTSPGTKLVISGSDDAASIGVIEIKTAGGTNLKIGGDTTYSWIQSHASRPLYINQLGNNIILNGPASGNVGIGTTSPSEKLHVDGNARVTGAYYDTSNSPGAVNQLLSTTVTGTTWIDPSTITAEAATLVVIACKNTSGATITKGTPVYQTGTVGATATIEIAPADALISTGDLPAIGLLQTTLNNQGLGFVVITGKLINIITSPIDGVVPVTGDKVYLKSGGGLTLVKPTTSLNGIQNLGLIGKVSTGLAGTITVSSIMRTNDVPNLPTGRTWVGNSNTEVSQTVYIDEPNLRLGIGTTSPAVKLDVNGQIRSNSEFLLQSGTTAIGSLRNQGGAFDIRADSTRDVSLGSVTSPQALFIEGTNGNVGIGTATPTEKLHVDGSGLFSGNLIVDALSTVLSDDPCFRIKQNGITKVDFGWDDESSSDAFVWNYSNGGFKIGTNGSERFKITSTGNVGIGTTSPAVKLDVNGSGLFSGNLTVDTTSGESIYISPVSNVVEIRAVSTVLSDDPAFRIKQNGNFKVDFGWDDDGTSDAFVWNYSNGGFKIGTNGSERMRIDASGNVGIGTTSPSAKLSINTGAQLLNFSGRDTIVQAATDPTNANIYVTQAGVGDFSQLSGSLVLQARTQGTVYRDIIFAGGLGSVASPATQLMTITGEGNVGIGTTSPGELLHLSSSSPIIKLTDSDTGASSILNANSGAGSLFIEADISNVSANSVIGFKIDNSERMRITNAGNVGIGTTSPNVAFKLDVIGNTSTSGNLYIGNADDLVTPTTILALNSGRVRGVTLANLINASGGPYLPLSGGTMTGNLKVSIPDTGGSPATTAIVDISGYEGRGAGIKIKDSVNSAVGASDREWFVGTGYAQSGFNIGYSATGASSSYIAQNKLSIDTSGNATFAGAVTVGGNINLADGAPRSIIGALNQSLIIEAKPNSAAEGLLFQINGTDKLSILNDGNATFAGNVTTGASLVSTNVITDNIVAKTASGNLTFKTNGGATIAQFGSNLTASFQGTVSAPTFSGDLNGTINTVTTAVTKANATSDTTVATTAFVQNLIGTIPAGLVFQGTWDAATNTPTLTSGSGTTGNFYIVSTSGSTNLDGVTDWVTGDWAVFIEQGTTDAWEKIDNSSVLDGTGTGQTLPLWDGSGNSNTLTDSKIVQNTAGTLITAFTNSLGNTGNFITNSEGGGEVGLTVQSRTNRAKLKVADNDSSAYVVAEAGKAFYGTSASGDATNITVLTTGNVGIGTTSPAVKLDINGGGRFNTTTGATPFYITRNGANDQALKVHVDDQNVVFESIQDETADDYGGFVFNMDAGATEPYFDVRKNNSTIMRVDGNGNVGIGTTGPSAKLDVAGDVFINSNYTGSNAAANDLTIGKTTTGNHGITIATGPTYTGSIYFGDSGNNDAGIIGYQHSDNSMKFTTNRSERMRITSAGNVGIGTTSPIALGGHSGILTLYGSNATALVLKDVVSEGHLRFDDSNFKFTNSGGDVRMQVEADTGNVGIGTTSPYLKLHVAGDTRVQGNLLVGDASAINTPNAVIHIKSSGLNSKLRIEDSDSVNQYWDFLVDQGNALYFNEDTDTRVTFKEGGNVGIGTTLPQSKLQVAGGIQMADDTDTASASKVGTIKYRVSGNNSYVDMCMQTGAATYAWINIVQNNW